MGEAGTAPQLRAADDELEGGFGLYVHWPFCAAKCPYCDFNSHVRAGVDHARWARALVTELERQRAASGPGPLDSVFFGGGTPSMMAPATVAAVLDAAARLWGFAPDAEITLEANPTSVDRTRFAGFRSAGVGRLSLGVQALDDGDLKALGRLHDSREALAAHDVARGIFDRVSIDLIYARQGQSRAAWEAELRRALALGVEHLSLYQLTIEPDTRFGALHARGRLRGLPDADLAADLFETTQALCHDAGLPAYEVSNHARPGREGRHNLVYWRAGRWVGVGPGAHGRLGARAGRVATAQVRAPEAWLRTVEAGGRPETQEPVPEEEQIEEALLMGLRLREGVPLERLRRLGWSVPSARLAALSDLGLVEVSGDRLLASELGWLVLDRVIAEVLD